MGKTGTYLVNFALLVTQFGFCCVYLLFIASHLNEVPCAAGGRQAWSTVGIATCFSVL